MHLFFQRGVRPALLGLFALAVFPACRTASTDQSVADGPDTMQTAQTTPQPTAGAQQASGVIPGLEILVRDSAHLIRGKRVGLITNHSAITRTGEHAIDVIARAPGANLVALYTAEHGIRGTVEAGLKIETDKDAKTGAPIFSLYGKTQRPTDEMLKGVDVLLFDMQDVGVRPYTYVWTMAMAIEEAAKRKIPFVVLDRPNPITGAVDGPLMDMAVRNVTQVITGYYAVPLRHGMTAGEIARYFNEDARVGAQLHVVPVEGWRGNMWFDQTGLRWTNPSPNIRSLDAALKFSGLVLADGATNVHTGRGTDAPFSYFGAPWLNAQQLIQAVAQYNLPGVRLVPEQIRPTRDPAVYTSYRDTAFTSLRLEVTDRNAFRPVFTTLVLLTEAKRQAPDRFRVMNTGFTQMIGSRWAREAFDRGDDPREIARRWEEENRAWISTKQDRYRLYPRS
ncbi:DUF1343 domain-containing protein [soil metagenome]